MIVIDMGRIFITPHAHVRAGGYVIGAGVHIYIFLEVINFVILGPEMKVIRGTHSLSAFLL